MAFGGHLHCIDGNQEPLTINQALVTSDRVFIEWTVAGGIAHLEAMSVDGAKFRGEYRTPLSEAAGTCELTLFKSLHEYLLCGQWNHPASEQHGMWVFRLQTDMVRPNKTKRPQQKSNERQVAPRNVRRAKVEVEMTRPSGASLSSNTPKSHSTRDLTESLSPLQETVVVPHANPSPCSTQPAAPMFSSQLDHLMRLTSVEFMAQDRGEIEALLGAAPSSAVFKLSRNAAAPELKELAVAVIDRQRIQTESSPLKPASDPIVDAKTLRAQQRRSSKHWKR